MALQTFTNGNGLFLPYPFAHPAGVPAFASVAGQQIDASGEKVAFVIQVSKSGTLDKFEFRLDTVTQAPGNGLKCSFQDVSATDGAPDGSIDQFRVVTSGLTANTWVAPGLITSDGTDGGAKRTVTRGQLLACVIEFESFTAGDNLRISLLSGAVGSSLQMRCYGKQFTASWNDLGNDPIVALKYDDGSYAYCAAFPISAINTATYNNGSTPDERGLIFQFPVQVKVGGAWVRADTDGDCDLVLYDSNGTSVLETVSLDKDVRVTNSVLMGWVPFSQDHTLAATTNYRLVMKPMSATNVSIYDFDVDAAAILGAVGGGTAFHYTQRTDAGSWTETTTKRPFMGLYVTAIHDGSGGGGGTRAYVG